MEEPQGDSTKAHYDARESISLAFVAALQRLPPRQRATFVLRDVLGFRTAEAADILGCTADAVNGSLKRARATIASHLRPDDLGQPPPPGSARERELLARFADAWERGDLEGRRFTLIPPVRTASRRSPATYSIRRRGSPTPPGWSC